MTASGTSLTDPALMLVLDRQRRLSVGDYHRMIGAGILDGDMVVVRRAQTASDGEIVVALIEDEATVKRLRRTDGRVQLMPENDAYEPIVSDEITVLGVVCGVMRAL